MWAFSERILSYNPEYRMSHSNSWSWTIQTLRYFCESCNHEILLLYHTCIEFIKSKHLQEPAKFYSSSQTIQNCDWAENTDSRKESDSQYQYAVLRNNAVHYYHFKLPAIDIYTRNAFLKVIKHCERLFWWRESLGFDSDFQ
jgi:hypothetical protein